MKSAIFKSVKFINTLKYTKKGSNSDRQKGEIKTRKRGLLA